MTILSFSTPLLPETLLELTIIHRAGGTPIFWQDFFQWRNVVQKQMNLDVQLQFAKNHLFCPDFFLNTYLIRRRAFIFLYYISFRNPLFSKSSFKINHKKLIKNQKRSVVQQQNLDVQLQFFSKILYFVLIF